MQNVHVCESPLLQHRLAILRDKTTAYIAFRQALVECGALMGYEIARELPMKNVEIETPLETVRARKFSCHVTLVAILRAALGFVEGLATYLPAPKIGHLGLYRDEQTLMPVQYYAKLPQDLSRYPVIIADPMLATGGSLVAALEQMHRLGCAQNVFIAALLAAPEGITRIHQHFPETRIYVAAIDRQLNNRGYILPGLGDAGDRQYGTE